ncbi:hypothetical protein [Demetria terragena]|uniref:hypothetical protein n=1 Tax=Demetria terragena TaxID=63959 RepID=UPI00036BC822|nr:hypothetical protein [Demetria terragena]
MTDLKAVLVRVLRAAYPHEQFPDGPYERTADTILAGVEDDLWHRVALESGLKSLQDSGFQDLSDQATEAVLQEIATAEFFAHIRGVAVVTLYNDHEVWELLGYEGASFDQGGYVNRGFNDLDWLPDPRVEEYDGPDEFVAVADQDQPTV